MTKAVWCTLPILREVSTHGIRLVLSTLERLGVPIRPILAQLPVEERELRTPGGRVDWDVWVDLIEAVDRQLGELGGFDMLSAAVQTSRAHPFQAVARLLSSPLSLYQLNSRWGVPNQYRHMRSTCEPLSNGRLRVTLSIPPHYRGSSLVFRSSLGILRNLPTLIGLPASSVESYEVTSHSLSTVLALPGSRTLFSQARRVGERLLGLGSVLAQLGEQEEELGEKSAILEQQLEEQKRIESALRISEERWRALAQNVPGIILILSHRGELISASRAFRGIAPEALIGRALADLVEPNHRELIGDAIGQVRDELRIVDVRFQIGAGLEETWYACRLGPMASDGPHPLLCAFLTDITERLRVERELKLREEELSRNQRLEALGRLAGGVAHDFNNLLTVIRGGAELLLSGPGLDPEQREEVEEIDKAADRAATLTRQLLAFSRQQVIAPQQLQLTQVIQSARPMLERLLGEDIQVELTAHRELPLVLLDRSQMEQILMNLAVNARDAMPRGGTLGITIESVQISEAAAFQERLPAGRYVQLSVSDTGLGMEADISARIFEPFFSTKRAGAGTGLGLAIVRGIAAQSGGDISVDSELGRGTTFRLRFPACDGVPVALEVESAPIALRAAENATILVVEDDGQVRALVAKVLRARGYRVIESGSAAEALVLSAREHIDLVLTDVVMPEISGPELARLLGESHPQIAVLFMSGYAEHEIVHRGIVNPDVSLLSKPFSSDALVRSVREGLERGARAQRKSS
ncbi:MAG: ATP-binding protein [Myxococcota bacterium]